MNPTIGEVAKIAGVSIATVSRVVNGKGKVGKACRQRVQKIIDELGYQPSASARSLAMKKYSNIGLVTPKISMEFFGRLAAGIEDECRKNDYSLLISNSLYEDKTEIQAIDNLASKGCDAIILHSDYMSNEKIIEYTKKYPTLVVVNRLIGEVAGRCIWFDNVNASIDLTDYLIQNNHSEIAVLSSIYRNRDPQQRLSGIEKSLLTAGLSLHEGNVAESTANINGGKECVKELLSRGCQFTAIIAYNDLMAVGAIHELIKNGIKVPEDVSVVGFDDSIVGQASVPELTTVKYPIVDIAKRAVELCIELSNGDKSQHQKLNKLKHEIVYRQSVKCL